MGFAKQEILATGFFFVLAASLCSGLTDPRDVMALNNLYVSLGYPPLQGWILVGGDPCAELWQGVECVFSNVTAIKLAGANLVGELGGGLQFLGSVIELDFSNNRLGGSIPSALPPTLRNLSLSGNQLTGVIPDSFSTMSQLLELTLDNNLLVGAIPDVFQLFVSLMYLDLSSNNLTGPLPPSMGSLMSLSTMHLQNNRLIGLLDILQDLPLQDLDVEDNLFSGPIPGKLLSVPNFRNARNPFNTTIIPSPLASPTPSPVMSAYSPAGSLWLPVNGPYSLITPDSGRDKKFLSRKAIAWIAIGGIAIVILALLLCLLLPRLFKAKRKENSSNEHYLGAYKSSSEIPRNESSLVESNRTNAEIAKEAAIRQQEQNVSTMDARRRTERQRNETSISIKNEETSLQQRVPKKAAIRQREQDRNMMDVQRRAQTAVSMKSDSFERRNRSHTGLSMEAAIREPVPNRRNFSEIDMTDTDDDILPPPPPFLIEKVAGNRRLAMPTVATTSQPSLTSQSSDSLTTFTIASLQQLTNSFSQENFLGAGTLGSVYMAELSNGQLLAVKKLNGAAVRHQSDEEFREMVSNISMLRHKNIVELIGYCAEHGQRLLVHEACMNGTLHDALHTDEEVNQKLSWNRRIQVALGAARALEYLHEVCKPPVVHRNFKSSNLLLDDKLDVHVSDSGLAPLLSSPSVLQVSGQFNSHGYGAPEFESGIYTHQSDVYSFGVVLLELLTGRKAYDRSRPRGEHFLVSWAVPKLHDIDELSRMVDPSISGTYSMKSLSRFADIISSCIQREPEFRLPISEIVKELLQMS